MGRGRKTGRMMYAAADVNRRSGFPEEQFINALRSAGLAATSSIGGNMGRFSLPPREGKQATDLTQDEMNEAILRPKDTVFSNEGNAYGFRSAALDLRRAQERYRDNPSDENLQRVFDLESTLQNVINSVPEANMDGYIERAQAAGLPMPTNLDTLRAPAGRNRTIALNDFVQLAPSQQLELLDQPGKLQPNILAQIGQFGAARLRSTLDVLRAEEKQNSDIATKIQDGLKAQRRLSGGFSQREVNEAFNAINGDIQRLSLTSGTAAQLASGRILSMLRGQDPRSTFLTMSSDKANTAIEGLKRLSADVTAREKAIEARYANQRQLGQRGQALGQNRLRDALMERAKNAELQRNRYYMTQEMMKIVGRTKAGA